MRGAVRQNERHGLAFRHVELGDRRQILPGHLDGRVQQHHVRPGDRAQRAVRQACDPGHCAAVVEAEHQFHPHPQTSALAPHEADDVGMRATWWHEVDECRRAGRCLEARLQDERVIPILPRDACVLIHRRDQPSTVLAGAQQRRKARR